MTLPSSTNTPDRRACGAERPVRRKSRFDVSLIDLVRPDGYWPHPLTLEQAFETFRWMVAKGEGYATRTHWGHVGVKALLSATSANDDCSVWPIKSLKDLRERFHYAILGYPRSESIARWRADYRVEVGNKIRIVAPVYTPFAGARHLGWGSEGAIHNDFVRITTGCRGQQMAAPLNSVHLDCLCLHGVTVAVSAGSFRFVLNFGDPIKNDAFPSRWGHTIAVTRPGESFLDTFARARDVFDVFVCGATKPCDAADLLNCRQYGPIWHRVFIAVFARGERPDPAALRDAAEAHHTNIDALPTASTEALPGSTEARRG